MKSKAPKVLLFDLETFPNLAYTWGKYDQNVIKFKKEWELASFAYKWLGRDTITCQSQRTRTEKQLVEALHEVLSAADVVVAHNGDRFDIPKAKAKFVQFGLKPPTLNKSVDTRKIARSQFAFNSNSLNDLGETLKLGKKVDTGGFDLWLRCMAHEKAAWLKMELYNKHDVALLEKVYLKLRAWSPTQPGMAVYGGHEGCPSCGSRRVQAQGFRVALKRKIQRYQCQDCGHWFQGKALRV